MTRLALAAAPPKSGWDIHCHTVYSDGTQTPASLVELSRHIGLHGASISDHDTTSGWADAEAAAREEGMRLLRGTEITACDGPVSVHMLAYQYNPNDRHTSDLFARTRQARLKRTKAMVARLGEDYPISWQSVLEQVHEGERTTIGRPHIADALVAAGVYRTRSEAFADAVSATSKYYIPTPSPTTHEVLAAVARPNSTLLERFDFLVSFEPLDVDFPSVTVSPGVSRSDVDHIIASVPLWRRGREVHTAWERGTLSVGSSPESLFGSLHERLSADGLIDMPPARFERLVWTLSVVKDRTLVFAWCGSGVRRTGIRIYRLEEGEGAECGQCTMAAVLVAAPGDRADLTPLTQGFKRLVEDYADTSDLVSDDGFFVCFPEPE